MRLIARLNSAQDAKEFSYFLSKEKIDNVLEQQGEEWLIWIVQEEHLEASRRWLAKFQTDPTAEHFRGHFQAAQARQEAREEQLRKQEAADMEIARKAGVSRRPRFGWVTLLILLSCVGALITGWMQTGEKKADMLVGSSLYGALLYDFPKAFELMSQLVHEYHAEKPQELPPAGQELFEEAQNTPYWQGFYPKLLNALGIKKPAEGPLFEKIREGEVWRLWTPIFLHADWLHILFNMLWLVILGNQIEFRIGPLRYILLIAIAALISNTSQYLMSGPAFLGFSGVICAFLGFIWMRQRRAPWEGYQLNRPTVIFILIFVFALLAIQLVSFTMELLGRNDFQFPIANTAHFVGGAIGLLLGRFKFFAISRKV